MRRLTWIALAGAVALTAAGIAVAGHRDTARTQAVAATFSASRTAVNERTCTGADGTYRVAREVFEGTVTSADPRLAGRLTLRTKSLINQTTGYGTTEGSAWLRDTTTGRTKARARLTAVNTQLGVLNGVLEGRLKEGGRLVANFKATFSSPTAFSGELGSGAGENTAVVQSGRCARGGEDDDD
jgi:hypothetical protein